MTTAIIILGITVAAVIGINLAAFHFFGTGMGIGAAGYDACVKSQILWDDLSHHYYPM